MNGGPFAQTAQKRLGGEDAMLPLVNVVLLLLVFFMVAGTLRMPEAFPVTPPLAEGDGPAARRALLVGLSGDGRLSLDGQIHDRAALLAAIPAGARVTLRADAGAEARAALALALALQSAGAAEVSLVVLAP